MGGESLTRSVEFFDAQFQRQIREREYALNPFETLALDYLKGTVLDLGSGLGNVSLEAGRRSHHHESQSTAEMNRSKPSIKR